MKRNYRGYRAMKPRRLNLISALAALAGSLVWLALGQLFAGAVWFAASLVWGWMAAARYRGPAASRIPPPRCFDGCRGCCCGVEAISVCDRLLGRLCLRWNGVDACDVEITDCLRVP